MKQILLYSFVLFSLSAFADSRILTNLQMKALLGDYPAKGSAAEAEDFRILFEYQKNRTSTDCSNAESEETANFMNMFAGKSGPFTASEGKKIELKVEKLYAPYRPNVSNAKLLFKRKRPYLTNSQIVPCVRLENSYAYPSGHTSMAYAYAAILAKMYPEKEAEFIKRAEQIGLNRVIGGVHHPSDIAAGKKLGDYIGTMIDKESN